MAQHRFKVNVPNPTAHSVVAQLRLEPGKTADLPELPRDYRRGTLKVERAGLSVDPCAESGKRELKLRLEAHASIDVYLIVDTAAAKKPGAAGLHVIDSRGGKDVGGVFVVCVEPPLVEPVGAVVPTHRPCPASLADLFPVAPGSKPDKTRMIAVRPGDGIELVALIAADRALKGVQVYLEHLGTCNAAFLPATWSVGSVQKGDVFAATWALQTSAWQTGTFRASVVVVADGFDPTRLNGDFTIGQRKRGAAVHG